MLAIGLGLLSVLLGVVQVIGLALRPPPRPEVDPAEDELRARTELHAIRRRVDLAHFKQAMQADAARLRRELDAELDPNPPEDVE